MKLTTRCGSAAVEGLNEVLLAKALLVNAKRALRTARTKAADHSALIPLNS